MSMRILVKGAYGHANFGDDALMCCLEDFFIAHFNEYNVAFCANNDADYAIRLLKKSGFINMSKNKQVEADLLVYGGGTQFFLFNDNNGGIRQYLKRFRELLITNPGGLLAKIKERISGKPAAEPVKQVAALGIGLGPFHPDNNRVAHIANIVRNFNFLYVRDDQSVKYCLDWDCEEVGLGADICFSSYLKPALKILPAPVTNKRKKIGVIVRDWVHEDVGGSYNIPLMNVIRLYDHSETYEFVFIIFSLIKDQKWLQLLKTEGRSFVAWDPEKQTLDDFTSILNGFDGFITARYHGGVFAAILNKPAVCIEIEPKLKLLTKQIPSLALWEKSFDEIALKEQFTVFHDEDYDCSRDVKNLRIKSDNMFNEFRRYLKNLS